MKHIILVLTFLLASASRVSAQENAEEGKAIFRSRCGSCHAIDKRVIGPALKDVETRHPERWLIDFIHSSQTLINKGDENAVKLFNEYNKTVMPDHKDLSDNQIKNILAYIKAEGLAKKENSTENHVPGYTPPYVNKNGIIDKIVYLNFDEQLKPIKTDDFVSWLLIAALIVVFVTLFYILTFSQYILDMYRLKKTKNGVPDNGSSPKSSTRRPSAP